MLTVLGELSLVALVAVLAGLMLVDGTPLIGLLVPGDLVVISASTLAGWPGVLVAALVGAAALVCGHAAAYLVGRHYGAHLWSSRLGRKIGFARWCRAERTLREGGDRTLLATPFIPVVNTVLPLLAGALGVRPSRYLVLIAVADAAWVGLWIAVGAASQQLAVLLGATDVALLVSVAVSVLILLVTTLTMRRAHRRAHRDAPVPAATGAGSSDASDLPACVSGAVRDAASVVTAEHAVRPCGTDGRCAVTTGEPAPGVRVVTVTGEATIGHSPVLDAALREQVAALREGPGAGGHLVVDLTDVAFLNYHAVVALVWAHRAAARAGVAFHLVGADTPAVNRPLRIAGVLRHLDPHRRRSVAEVLADLGSGTHPAAFHGEQDR
jgi:membrane protein DedA with SNARE-associated domain/anti-anti-sigma regulatory factor